MVILVGFDRFEEAIQRKHAGIILQGFDQPFVYAEGSAQRLVQKACPGINQVDQVAQARSGVPRHRKGDRQLNSVVGIFILLGLLAAIRGCILGFRRFLGRLIDTVETCRCQRLQHLLNLLAVGAVAEFQRTVLGYRVVVDLVSCRRHALVLGFRAGRLRDDFYQRLALIPGYVVVNPHTRILLFFSPVSLGVVYTSL